MIEQKEYRGVGSIQKMSELLARLGGTRIFLVTGKKSFTASGAERELKKLMQEKAVCRFDDFSANPKIEDIERGIDIFRAFSPNLAIAVGGGSVMDMAKVITILAASEKNPRSHITGKERLTKAGIPLIAVPTTAGSGSEATQFAVVYVEGIKYSLEHPMVLPTAVILDPELTYSMSPHEAAVAGADALCQAIESYWSVQSTEESKNYARRALLLVLRNLKAVVLSPTKESRNAMSEAAHLAGQAINISKTTACHALSYPLTARFNIPHGHAVALTLSRLLRYNSGVRQTDIEDSRGVAYVKGVVGEIVDMVGARNVAEACRIIDSVFSDCGLELRLSSLGISQADLDIVAQEISVERMKNNPRRITHIQVRNILRNIL